ncbi:MAG: folylpolyglutamate synthase/dihydrofolate synthase family protein [Nanoarchaeota archaeon]
MGDIFEYLYGLSRFGMKPGLDVIEQLLAALGNPQERLHTIHVTGTNGKGSTCAYIAAILQKAGYTTGLYTSPHLMRFNERIRINGVDISDDELGQLAQRIKDIAETHGIQPTFFEFTTALAFLYFVERNVDYAVIEVGLGGRLDATNIINPIVAVITNIGFDHMEHLGDTLPAIAREKAGIIKQGSKVVVGEKDTKLQRYFTDVCTERDATMTIIPDVVTARIMTSNLDGQTFTVNGMMNDTFTLAMLGAHQVENALTALVAIQELKRSGVTIPDAAIKDGLATTHWAGRIDIISRTPLIILDGAHNLPGMQTLHAFAKDLPRRKVLVLAMKHDKDIDGMIELIVPLFDTIIVTQGNFKPTPAHELASHLTTYNKNVIVLPDVKDAIEKAFGLADQNDTVLITGSLYMVGDAMKALHETELLRH